MGLYIKDLDLPGAIEPELVMDFAVGLDGKVYARYYHHREGGLTDWKEVISIPDHGDLIDRDVLLKKTEDVWEMSARYSDGGFSRFLIECEPVVIPREGGNRMNFSELIKRLRSESCVPYTTLKTMREAADAIEELNKYADAIRKLKCEGWYLQQIKYHDGYQAIATMPLPEPPKEETE